MRRNTVLIVTDDPAFRQALERRWQAEPSRPNLAVLDSSLAGGSEAGCEVAVIGPVHKERLKPLLKALDSPRRTVLCFFREPPNRTPLCRQFRRVRFLHLGDDSADVAVVLAGEILRRLEAAARLQQAEHAASGPREDAAVGRSIRELRHDINNALTSVLGNAELLLLDGETLSAQAREQAETIRTHALHMHEIMRQLTSMETEAKLARHAAVGVSARPMPVRR